MKFYCKISCLKIEIHRMQIIDYALNGFVLGCTGLHAPKCSAKDECFLDPARNKN